MRVLFIGMTQNKGGTETFIMNAARFLWEKKVDVSFLDVEEHDLSYKEEILANGGTIIPYKIHKGPKGLLYNAKEAAQFFSQYQFDVIHVNTNILRNSFWAIAAKKSGIKQVYVHSHNSSYGARNKLKQMVYGSVAVFDRRQLTKYNVELLAASTEAGKWMFHNLPFEVIDNGVDTDLYRYHETDRTMIRDSLKISYQTLVVISVARFAYQKNQEKIVRVFSELLKLRSDSKLILVGAGDDLEKIKDLVAQLGISERVLFLGRRDDVPKLLSSADLMLFPSRYEGTPYSLMEAQSSGLPVIVSSEAFRESENITGNVKYLSLGLDDEKWAKETLDLAQKSADLNRHEVNEIVKNSSYSLKTFEKKIASLYGLN